jgi:hypothetical protein
MQLSQLEKTSGFTNVSIALQKRSHQYAAGVQIEGIDVSATER